MTTPGTAVYVYAVTRGATGLPPDLAGVDDGPVRILAAGELQAVVGDVDRAAFEERALEENLEDLTWLTATARAHHRVVDAVGRVLPVAPLALATVYFDDERVTAVLAEGSGEFAAVLDQLAGHAEWGVKVYAVAGSTDADERPASGADYLRRRRAALRDRDTTTERATEAAESLHRALEPLALAHRAHRLQDPTMTGVSDPMVLNNAYLVADDLAPQLEATVAGAVDARRIRVEVTGPWVPYSFVQIGGAR